MSLQLKQTNKVNSLFSWTIWVSWYQKDCNEVTDYGVLEWPWHRPNDMQTICTFLHRGTMPIPHHSVFTGLLLVLTPNRQFQSTEGITTTVKTNNSMENKKLQKDKTNVLVVM